MATQEKLIKAERLSTAGEMSAVIAHEARNSLTSVKMILQMLREKLPDNRKLLRSVYIALDSIAHLEGTVNQLLQFSRPEPLKLRPCSIRALVLEVFELMQAEMAKRNIKITMDLRIDLETLFLDETRLKEALVNLLMNAADSIQKEGAIRIAVTRYQLQRKIYDRFAFLPHSYRNDAEPQSEKNRDIVLQPGTDVLSITITDNGSGIPDEIADQIFNPFFTTKTKGTGLGLPLVRRIANEHGGTVIFSHASGSGAQFELIIPIRDQSHERKNHDRR